MKNLTATICLTIAMFIIVSTPVISADLHKVQTPPSQQKKPGDMIAIGLREYSDILRI